MSSKGESKSVRTYTVQEGNTVKTVTETTITYPDGRTVTKREESTTTRGSAGGSQMQNREDEMTRRMKEMQMPSGMHSRQRPSPAQGQGSSGSGSGPVSLEDFRKQGLKAHNEKRAKHGVPALKLSKDLNDYAQKWADHLVKTNTFQHSSCTLGNDRLGENIANKWSSAGTDYTGEQAVDQWYSEIKDHNFKAEVNRGTGHFTQVVWKDTQELGLGKAKASDGKVIVVGSYRPAGNMVGSFTKNVFPPK